ncbi:hypothetical protein NYP20_17685 [Pseudomonas sp. N3-W]|uniref:Lipoprotein n=1 Tax=Pseudomonas fungipugnans TaxID=3024217 RepID=A0ABT6QIN0_9PSED|nr:MULTISPECIES: hypothetical protein [unclassified Pseudomonas]MDI2590739.1 hypothetical protein [Pseudomonas sp. 681]UWF47179.1 hypothetical protein NYP20_17685 [Pseudomonas sp. N3-W]
MKKNILLTLSLFLILPGCHSNVRDSSPSLLKDGVQLHQNTVTVDPEHAKVIMKATGNTRAVEFSIRRAADPDQRMEKLGVVVNSGRGKVFGWIAKLNETANSAALKRFPQLETLADAGQVFLVSGYAGAGPHENTYICGPLESTFTPEKGKVYQVEFEFVGDSCQQHVYDVTQPQQRIPVVSQPAA